MTVTVEELKENIIRYLSIEKEISVLEDIIKKLPVPVLVTIQAGATTLENAVAYDKELEEYNTNKRLKEHALFCLKKDLVEVNKELINLLPVKNIWIKVDDFAIIKWVSAWGGHHGEMKLTKWIPNLEPISDQLHFD